MATVVTVAVQAMVEMVAAVVAASHRSCRQLRLQPLVVMAEQRGSLVLAEAVRVPA